MTDTQPEQTRSLAARCAATCRRGVCTGLGSASLYAHRCQFVPPPPPPSCTLLLDGSTCGAAAAGRFLAGWRCEDHAPRRPSTAPSSTPSPSEHRSPREYGTATTDPLGRDGPGWHTGKQSALPTRDAAS